MLTRLQMFGTLHFYLEALLTVYLPDPVTNNEVREWRHKQRRKNQGAQSHGC